MNRVEVNHPDFLEDNPSRGWAKHIRHLKANLRKEKEREQNQKLDLDPRVEDYLSGVIDSASASLRGIGRTVLVYTRSDIFGPVYQIVPNPEYPSSSAELKLTVVWARARLAQLRPGSVERRVFDLIDELHIQQNNDHLTEVIGQDEKRRPIKRYQQMLMDLEAGMPPI